MNKPWTESHKELSGEKKLMVKELNGGNVLQCAMRLVNRIKSTCGTMSSIKSIHEFKKKNQNFNYFSNNNMFC